MVTKNEGFSLITLGIVAIMSFAAGALLFMSSEAVQLSPEPPTTEVHAHECGADHVCEMNSASVLGNLEVLDMATATAFDGEFLSLKTDGEPERADFTHDLIQLSGTDKRLDIASTAIRFENGDATETATFSPEEISSEGLAGDGNSYVCVDSTGALYRCATP